MFIELLGLYKPPSHPRALRYFRVHYADKENIMELILLLHDIPVVIGDVLYISDIDTPLFHKESDLKEYGLYYKLLVTLRPVGLWSL